METSQMLMVVALFTGVLIFCLTVPVLGPWAAVASVLGTVVIVLGIVGGGAMLVRAMLQSWAGIGVLVLLAWAGIRRVL